MPRNIKTDPDSAKRFVSKCKEFHLHTVLILTEKEEYEKYAGADLEEFYNSLGLEVIHRPIADFTIPNQPDMIQNIKVCLPPEEMYSLFVYTSFFLSNEATYSSSFFLPLISLLSTHRT